MSVSTVVDCDPKRDCHRSFIERAICEASLPRTFEKWDGSPNSELFVSDDTICECAEEQRRAEVGGVLRFARAFSSVIALTAIGQRISRIEARLS